jgi:putative addiction module CopG family antidote
MKFALSNDAKKLIEDRMKSGKYASPDEVVLAALGALESKENAGDFGPGELDELIAIGEKSGPALAGKSVLAELRGQRPRRRPKAG